jgi:hypothetical protein
MGLDMRWTREAYETYSAQSARSLAEHIHRTLDLWDEGVIGKPTFIEGI